MPRRRWLSCKICVCGVRGNWNCFFFEIRYIGDKMANQNKLLGAGKGILGGGHYERNFLLLNGGRNAIVTIR